MNDTTECNLAMYDRMVNTNFDPSETRNASYTHVDNVKHRRQSHFIGASGKLRFNYMAIIPLKYLSQYFANSMLAKGTYLKLLVNVNTATTTLGIDGSSKAITSVNTVSFFNYCLYILF